MIFKNKFNTMKKIILTTTFLFVLTLINAQKNELLNAFAQSYSNEKNQEYAKAAYDLESIYLKYMSNYEINLRLGWLKNSSGDLKQSENYYSKAMELKPLALEAIYGKILPLIGQEKYSKVLQLAEKALSIAPNDSKAEYFIGLANYHKNNYSKSEKYLEKAINKYPFDLDLNLMLGWTKFALGKKNEAKALFLVAQRNSPDNKRVKNAIELINK
jgi:tetratricopeptide (TPR) repeat protein